MISTMVYEKDNQSEASDVNSETSDAETTSVTPLIHSAIEEVLEEGYQESDTTRSLAAKVLERLIYYFTINDLLDDSPTFVEAVSEKVEALRASVGGNKESLLYQALNRYSTFIMREINIKRNESDESGSDRSSGEEDSDDEDGTDGEEDIDGEQVSKEASTDNVDNSWII
jgi:hypothetical protein